MIRWEIVSENEMKFTRKFIVRFEAGQIEKLPTENDIFGVIYAAVKNQELSGIELIEVTDTLEEN